MSKVRARGRQSFFAILRPGSRSRVKRWELSAAVVFCLVLAPAAHGNDVVNGDFQTGLLAPSTTAYSQSDTMNPPETWNIVRFDTLHGSWSDFFDHTHGNASGFFMVVNGTSSGLGPAWAQSVSVTPNTEYELSAWFATLIALAPASLELRLYDGATPVTTSAFFAPSTVGDWERHATTFNSGTAATLSIEIWDTNLAFNGNDYAIDDISLEVPEPGALLLAVVGLLILFGKTNRRSG